MYKALVHEFYTKRDSYGNIYRVARVTNPKTMRSFMTETPSIGNVASILSDIFGRDTDLRYYITERCTESSRFSSLPTAQYLDCCNESEKWRKALRGIGYRLPKVTA